MTDNFEPNSKEMKESELHEEKHDFPKNSTDAGKVISCKPQSANANSSIRHKTQPDSNEIDAKHSQCANDDLERTVTDKGMFIVFNPVEAQASASIRFRGDPISKTME
jgi:hypothetical protein